LKSTEGESKIWQTTVFVVLIVILVNLKRNKIARVVKLLREKFFGVNVIYINAILKRNKTIVASVLNFLVIC